MEPKLSWYERHREDYVFVALRGLARNKKGLIGGAILSAIIICAIFAPILSPYDPNEMHGKDRNLPPNSRYLLGTDMFGRDILSRLIWGSRISIYVGLISVSIALGLGVLLGMISGYYKGIIDELIMRIMDALLSFPTIFLALVIISVLGVGIDNLMIAIGIVYTPQFARITRGSVLSISNKEFVEAARSVGDRDYAIMSREVLPNCLAPIIVQLTIGFAYAILYEALFGFLGLGVQPPTPAWGSMLSEARGYMELAPWMTIFPGAAIFLAVLGFNLFGDALRDILDPRLRID
jgi:peptide/nickel transport system permease protein